MFGSWFDGSRSVFGSGLGSGFEQRTL